MAATRQWFSFPPAAGAIKTSRLRSFRLLIETCNGHVIFVVLRAKSAPDQMMAERVITLLGDCDPYQDQSQANARLDDIGLHAELLDSPFYSEDIWLAAPVLAEILLAETLLRMKLGERFPETARPGFEEQLRHELQTRISGFIGKLDGIAVEAARSAEACRPSSYNYLRGTGAINANIRRNRCQVASTFPFLFPLLPVEPRLQPIRQAIDKGTPLVDILARHFGAPKAVIRSLRHQPGSCIGPHWALRPDILTKLLTDIPDHLRPQTADMWGSFNTTVTLISKISGRPVGNTADRLWLRAAALQGYRVSEFADIELERAADDIDEFTNNLTGALNFQLRATTDISNGMAAVAAVKAFITAHNPIRLTKLARRWREAYIREQASFSEERQLWVGARWIAVISDVFETERRRIVCLTTATELVAEGNVMHNCVASYAGPCLQGVSQIWSVRNLKGDPRSTLETKISEDTLQVRLAQHRGPNNTPPDMECREAASQLIKHLNNRTNDLAVYVHWKKTIANRPADEKTMIALYRPVIASLASTLPKQWPFEKLLSIARERIESDIRTGWQQRRS